MMKPGHVKARGLSQEEFARVIEREVQSQRKRFKYYQDLEKTRQKEREKKKKAKEINKEGKYGPIFR